jgi:phenylpropionate dioxygenase-like ring-hydroxylating dioxygenase large terminal subunit
MSREHQHPAYVPPSSERTSQEPVVIPECWYAIADGRSVSQRPLTLERLGRRLVLWRDDSGAVACLPAACPHRGADLGLGRVRGGEIECPYHGFRFARSGACTTMPCAGRDARIPASLRARAVLVREAHGLIWLWEGGGEPVGEPPWLAEAPGPSRRHATWAEDWPICFTRVMEGMQDLHHFPFAHRKLDPWRGRAARLAPLEFEVDGELLRQRAGLCRDRAGAEPVVRFDLRARFPGVVYLHFGDRLDGVVACCPIDDARTFVWVRYRVRSGLGPIVDRVAASLGLWSEFTLVQPDDKRMLASSWPQRASARDSVLVEADGQIAAWHKLRRARLRDASEVAVGDRQRRG